ncbi:MAG TPA: phosphopantetheine-binding protein, partial [Thermoanaerobaculia bacterium]|nr:phosphopantetheine-binding protein [Thermoanaerobaculia bacterium]
GQGLLTRRLLPALAQVGPVDYTWTDLGRAFVLHAERELSGPANVHLRFQVLDAAGDPAAQGLALGSFHAVVGADVVHATPRIAETLGHLRSLLVPGGLLGLTETVRRERWGDLVWGLTDGWWAFEDTDLRTTSPLLSPDTWERVLAEAGFALPRAWARNEAAALLLGRAIHTEAASSMPFRATEPGGTLAVARAFVSDLRPGARPLLVSTRPEDRAPFAALASESGGLALHLPVHPARPISPAGVESLGDALRQVFAAGVSQAVVSAGHPLGPFRPLQPFQPAGQPEAPALPAPSPRSERSTRSARSAALHDRPHLQNPYLAPRDETERRVAAIWQRALGVERIGVDDHFLELGGDSLLALSVTHAIEREFDLAGRSFNLFENPTVAAIARFLGEGVDDPVDDPAETDFAQRASRGERRRERRRSARSTPRSPR